MPDLKISQLTDGNPAQTNDQIPVNRAGVNLRVTAGSIASLATANSANTEVLFNNNGVVDGDPQFTFNPTGDVLSLTGQLNVDNIRVDGNTVSTTNTNGNLVLAPNGTGDVQVDADTLRVGDSGVNAIVTTNGAGNLTLSTNEGTNSGTIVITQGVNGNIVFAPNGSGVVQETVGGVNYNIVSQFDVGILPNQIPLNQYLGSLAYINTETPALDVGAGITSGAGTICKVNGGLRGGIYQVTILIDLTGLNSGGTAGDIIGVNGTALSCSIAQLPAITVLGGRMTCLETPAGGDTDIDLYSATVGTGVEDQAISGLTGQTQIINAGTQSIGTVTYFAADPGPNVFLYLVGQSTSNATYTAGRFLIEIFGV